MKLAIDIKTQDEYTIVREFITKHKGRCGFDSPCGKGFIYVLDGRGEDISEVRIGCTKDIPEIKKQGYKYVLASELFKEQLSIPNFGYCCEKFKYNITVRDLIYYKNNKYYLDDKDEEITYCPYCGKKLEMVKLL
jgi:hypothetical protein